MSDSVDLAVVGAGAAGLVAAISAARRGASVAVLERLPWIGKKLLATGGGRCNLLNDGLSASAYTSSDPGLVAVGPGPVRPGGDQGLLRGAGPPPPDGRRRPRLPDDEPGRVGPQGPGARDRPARRRDRSPASKRRGSSAAAGRFRIAAADGRAVESRAVIIAGGGKSYPALGSNGSCYGLAASFGHAVVRPVPSAVPLVVKVRMCHFLQGQRMRVRAESRIGGRAGQTAEGELLFAQYGLSGTAILDVSESLSIALNRDGRKDVSVVVDFLPTMTEEELSGELARRLKAGWTADDLDLRTAAGKVLPVLSAVHPRSGLCPGPGEHRRGRAPAGRAAQGQGISRPGHAGLERGRVHLGRGGRPRGQAGDARIEAPAGPLLRRRGPRRPGRARRIQPRLGLGLRIRRRPRGVGPSRPAGGRTIRPATERRCSRCRRSSQRIDAAYLPPGRRGPASGRRGFHGRLHASGISGPASGSPA